MTLAIEAKGLTRAFGEHVAVRDVNLRVPEGRIFGYLGLNGAGKSTTIRMLTTLLPPSAGSASILGHDVVADRLAVRRLVGLLGDDGGESRLPWTGREFVTYFATLHDLPASRVEEVLDLVGLEPAWRRRPIGTYSTGMRRRVEVARALVSDPRVLFLDEPTRGLDLPAKRAMWELLRRLARERRVTIFLSSHEVAEIRALCEEIAVIARGAIVHAGPVASLGSDVDAFESRLIRLLEGEAPAGEPPAPR